MEVDLDETLPAYASVPAGARRGMVVLHEILGRQPEIDRVVDRFAAAGYAAVAPDLFARTWRPLCIRDVVRGSITGQGPAARAVARARSWLRGETGLPDESIGLIGFCLTGGFALAVGSGWPAVSANYGIPPPVERLRGIGAVLACYGGRDRVFARHAGPLEEALAAAGVPAEVIVYPGVGHSFLTDGRHPILARAASAVGMPIDNDPAVAAAAWQRILAFFGQHVSEGSTAPRRSA